MLQWNGLPLLTSRIYVFERQTKACSLGPGLFLASGLFWDVGLFGTRVRFGIDTRVGTHRVNRLSALAYVGVNP